MQVATSGPCVGLGADPWSLTGASMVDLCVGSRTRPTLMALRQRGCAARYSRAGKNVGPLLGRWLARKPTRAGGSANLVRPLYVPRHRSCSILPRESQRETAEDGNSVRSYRD